MNENQALQIVATVCGNHLCNQQDRIAINQALSILQGLVVVEGKKESEEKNPKKKDK